MGHLLSLEYVALEQLAMALVSFGSGGIREELHSSQRVDLREGNIHLQHRIVHIIVIYVFCTLLKSYQHLLTGNYPSFARTIKKVGPATWTVSGGERQKIKEHLSREFELDWKSLGISVLSVLKSF